MTELIEKKKKKIKNQDEEKKGKNIDGEVEKQREERFFSFVLEIYNIYFSIFQDSYVVLLMNLFGINFDFSIF